MGSCKYDSLNVLHRPSLMINDLTYNWATTMELYGSVIQLLLACLFFLNTHRHHLLGTLG